MENKEKSGIVMVSRAMEILNYLSVKDHYVGISEIAKDMGLPKATVFRIINSLEEWNAVEYEEGKGYHLGRFLIKLGKSASRDAGLIDICKPYMYKIAKEIEEVFNDRCAGFGRRFYLFSAVYQVCILRCAVGEYGNY